MSGGEGAAPAMSEEQAAEFAALAGGAAEPGPGDAAQAAAAGVEAAAGLSLAQEFGGLAAAFLTVAGPMFPGVKAIYTPDVIDAAAGSLAAVCVKHGWLQGGVMGDYAEEVAALLVCGPLALATVAAVKSDLARAKKANSGPDTPAPALSDAGGAVAGGEVGAVPVADESRPYVLARG